MEESDRENSLLKQAVNSLPIVVFAFDADGRVVLSEGKALAEMERLAGAAAGDSIFDLFAGERQVHQHIRRALSGDEHVADVTLDRNDRTHRLWFRPSRDETGRLAMVTALLLDLTESEHVDRELHAVVKCLETIQDHLPTALFRVDAAGTVTLARGAILPEGAEEAVGLPLAETYAHWPDLVRRVQLAMRGQDQTFSMTNGERSFELYVRGLNDGATRQGAVGVVIEVTEQARAALRLKEMLDATIVALASAVELRDPYTAGHQRRVAQLAREIAVEMNLDQSEIDGIFIAASIHDIGKIAVPSELLAKPGPLTPAEAQMIEQHAHAGASIVSTVPFPWPVAAMIRQHHERMDGSGYPLGLAGEDILVGARIIAVADTVEAMSSRRPYRAPKGISAALAVLEAGSGTQFDEDAVRACLTVIREHGFRFSRT